MRIHSTLLLVSVAFTAGLAPSPLYAQSGEWSCPSKQQAALLSSPSVLETMLPDYDGKFVWLWGYAGGGVHRNQWSGDYTLEFFNRDMTSMTSKLYMNADMVRSWLAYTNGDEANGFHAKALVGVRGDRMTVMKLCGFNRNGDRKFESDEYGYSYK